MRVLFLILMVGLMLEGFSLGQGSDPNQKFEALANRYIEQLLKFNPEWATMLGEHKYDHRLSDISAEGILKQKAFQTSYRDSLSKLDAALLLATNRIDYEILLDNINSMIYEWDTIRSYEWNPLDYNCGDAIYILLARDFAPLEERLRSVKERLKAVPTFLEQAKANLKNPPRIFTETAIEQNDGLVSLVHDELNGYLIQAPAMKDEFKPIQDKAIAAIEDYGRWLKQELLPRSTGDFRLGEAKYRGRLRYALESNLPKEEILRRAEADIAITQEAMYGTALPLFKKYFPEKTDSTTLANKKLVIRAVMDHLAQDHPTEDNVVDYARACLKECTDFVKTHNLVTVPDAPIKVVVMPEYAQGIAVAYCESPGALEKKGETFYVVSPPPKDWSSEQIESYFRMDNNYYLKHLTIHEAMPGHYLQAMHSNQFKAPTLVRAIFGSGTFVEGWACYAGQLMAQQGFGGPELKMIALKEDLKAYINAIIDQKIHTAGMTHDEAVALMVNEGFQEKSEAESKWTRACLSSAQLSTYYVGLLEIKDIRKAYEDKHGKQIDLKAFHDQLLSYGSPAPKYIGELMGL